MAFADSSSDRSRTGHVRETRRAYVALLLRTLPAKVPAALALIIAVALLETIGLLLLIPLLGLAGLELGAGPVGRAAKLAAAVLAALGLAPTLATVLVLYVAVLSGRALLQRWQSIAITDLQTSFVSDLRRRLFRAVLRTRWVHFVRRPAAEFVHALTSQVSRIGYAAEHLLPLVAHLLIVAVYLALAFAISPLVTLLVAGSGLGLLLLLRRPARRALLTGERTNAVTGRLYAGAIEQVGGLKTTRSYGAEQGAATLFDSLQGDVAAAELATQREFTQVRLRFEIGAAVVLSLMLYVSVNVLSLAVAEILLLIYLFGRVVPRLSGIQRSYQYFLNALPAFEAVMKLTAECEAECEPCTSSTQPAPALREAVRLRQVTFGYPASAPRTLRELDLEIPAHCTTAIVGPSGAGKSTIADLVLGLIVPDAGRVLIDDVLLTPALLPAWRGQIGYVSQDGFLFHETIRENLLWARPGATDAELWDALRLASAEGFVRRHPAGLGAVIGDRGVLLAGGERQRLALARALLRRPALLILDEATSALDSENERQIHRAIATLHGRTTLLLIAHRLSTIRDADVIHVVEDGRLMESGTWSELIRANGRFVDLCRAQHVLSQPAPERGPRVAVAACS